MTQTVDQGFKQHVLGCKHLKARAEPGLAMGVVHCPDCGATPPLWKVFNNWLDELQANHEELQEAKNKLLTQSTGNFHGKCGDGADAPTNQGASKTSS
jgi:hypothetical protein